MEKANNLLLISDWEMRKFIKIVVVIQLVTWGLVGSSALGLEIPILTQITGFIYVTFVPGIVLLRVFKIHRLCSIDTLLLSVGLSISFQMFIDQCALPSHRNFEPHFCNISASHNKCCSVSIDYSELRQRQRFCISQSPQCRRSIFSARLYSVSPPLFLNSWRVPGQF